MRCHLVPAMVALTGIITISSVTSVAADPETKSEPITISVFDAGSLEVPADFEKTQPRSRIVEHEFQVKAGEGEDAKTARLTMMPAGGNVQANIKRWHGQFTGGDPEDQKTEELKLGDWVVHLVDVSGTFSERMGGGPFAGGKVVERPDYAMIGAILVHPEGRKYFVKMTGPASVVTANREAFVKMIKSIEK